MTKKILFLSIVIIVLAALPRSVELFAGNYLWGFDQGLFFEGVKNIVVDHKLTLIGPPVGGEGGFFQGAGWYYLLAITFVIFSGNPFGAMLLMFIIGLAVVALAIFLGKKMFGEKAGLLIGFLIATADSIIPQSRFIWPPFPISLLAVLFLYFFYEFLRGRKNYLALAALSVSLMSHFETATSATFLCVLILFSPVIIWKKLISAKSFALSVIAFILPFFPLFLFDLRHKFIISKGILQMFNLLNRHSQTIHDYKNLIVSNHFGVIASNFSAMFPYASDYWLFIAVVLLFSSLFYLKDKNNPSEKRLFLSFLIFSPFALFLVFLLYRQAIWTWWVLELPVFYCFLMGILLEYFSRKKIWGKILASFIITYFLIAYIPYTVNAYTKDYKDYGGIAKIKGKLDALDYIYKDAGHKKFGLLVFTPPVYTYAYDYLIWWYGQKKYDYIPYQEKKGIFYLLMEPDPEKPWSYQGWLETVIKAGKVISTKKLPSGFIVQKREI